MKILIANKFFDPHRGGVETYTRDLSCSLRDLAEVQVLAGNDCNKTVVEEYDGIKIVRARLLGFLSTAPISPTMPWWLRKILREKFDVIHVQVPSPSVEFSLLFANISDVKLIVTYHSDIVGRILLQRLYRPLVNRILAQADSIIVTSEEYLASSKPLQPFRNKCQVIPIGVSMVRFEAAALKRDYSGLSTHKGPVRPRRNLLFVGRMVRYKGLDVLLRAMQCVDALLTIAGDGPKYNQLCKLARHLGINHKVSFLRGLNDDQITELYGAADVFVFPSISRNEAFGIAQLEAMASSVPIVSTRLDTGVVSINQHMETGLVVPPGDPTALAEAINKLLGDDSFRRQLGINARQWVRENFDRSLMMDKTIALYMQVLSSPSD